MTPAGPVWHQCHLCTLCAVYPTTSCFTLYTCKEQTSPEPRAGSNHHLIVEERGLRIHVMQCLECIARYSYSSTGLEFIYMSQDHRHAVTARSVLLSIGLITYTSKVKYIIFWPAMSPVDSILPS